MRGTVYGIRSLYGLFKVLKCNHQHGHFCHFVYIEYYSAGDIFTKFVKFYPLARFASSRCSELSAAFGDLRACYRGRVRITVALASAVIFTKTKTFGRELTALDTILSDGHFTFKNNDILESDRFLYRINIFNGRWLVTVT